MRKFSLILAILLIVNFNLKGQNLVQIELEDLVLSIPFKLENHQSSKAIVLIIMTNSCPFSRLYEDRIINLQKSFDEKEVVFALINPLVNKKEEESLENIKSKIAQKNIKFSYLLDPDQRMTKSLKATKSPEAFVLTPSPTGFAIVYQGAIDNNPQLAQSVTKRHLETAINHVLKGQTPVPPYIRPVGCNIN